MVLGNYYSPTEKENNIFGNVLGSYIYATESNYSGFQFGNLATSITFYLELFYTT